MKKYIYADNAATTQISSKALEKMMPWIHDMYANASQPYTFARQARKAISEARESIAECIGAKPEEIFFTSGGTESDNWAIKGSALSEKKRLETITTVFEHQAVLKSCNAIKQMGYPVKYISPNGVGMILPRELKDSLSDKTRLVSIMYANNEIGTIQPIKELCEIAHSFGAVFHTDAVQAIGHVPINVQQIDFDMLSASAHKFNGPKGIGFLFVRHATKIIPFIDGGSQEQGYRAGTENVPFIIAMATALKENIENLKENQTKKKLLESTFFAEMNKSNIKFIKNGGSNTLPGLISISFPGYDGEAILHRMDLAGISISTGSACNGMNTEISHVLKAINLDEKSAKGTIRISVGKDNTTEDMVEIASKLKIIVLEK